VGSVDLIGASSARSEHAEPIGSKKRARLGPARERMRICHTRGVGCGLAGTGSGHGSVSGRLVGLHDGPMGPST
jgi:hypothetical protein